jgi:hypothetical protein
VTPFTFPVRSVLLTLAVLCVSSGPASAQSPNPGPAPSGFFRDIRFSAIGDAYLVANANRPPGGENLLRNFDTESGSPRLNYIEAVIERAATADHRVGFRADLGAGPAATLVGAPEPGPGGLRFVQQAYVSALVPIGSGLTTDAGKFVTPAGAEVIETRDNWNYSRSLLFAWAIPYYHAGVRASYAVGHGVTATAFVLNGWNNVRDNNSSKTLAAQVIAGSGSRVSVAATWLGGAEHTDLEGRRHTFDAVVTARLTPALTLQVNGDLVRDAALGEGTGWQGISAALRARVTPEWTVSPRVEVFSDPQGASPGRPQDVWEATLTVERALAEGLVMRGEYRIDRSSAAVFPASGGRTQAGQQTVGVGFMYGWSSR